MKKGQIYFVYIGSKLPKYAKASLRLADEFSGLEINLIGSKILKKNSDFRNVNFIEIEDFYDNSQLIEVSKNLLSSHTFREGFWLKSLERFFVLEQYMRYSGCTSILHAELDQLLFGVDLLLSKLAESEKDGLYVPYHSSGAAVASLIYIRNVQSLSEMIKFSSTEKFDNEMQLIADWGSKNPAKIFALPTIASEIINYQNIDNVKVIDSESIGGIVDAAQIGQWVAGIDPRNVPIHSKPVNKFIDSPNPFIVGGDILKDLIFMFNEEDNSLRLSYKNNSPIRIFNLHIHSKIHRNLLKHKPTVPRLFELVNGETILTFKNTRRIQIFHYLGLRFRNFLQDPQRLISRLTSSLNLKLGLRISSKPFISGDSFRKEADLVWERSASNFEVDDVKSDFVIFCESDCIYDLNEKILKSLTVPITLILGNSDQNHDSTFQSIRNNVNVKQIFAQNLVCSMDGFYPLPIGLENLWRSSHGKTSEFKKFRKVSKVRRPRIMWTFTIDTNPAIRNKAAQDLSNIEVADRFGIVSSREHRELLLSYSFIASPPGNGLDTHRTWEAIYLGCVPIVLRSYMTEYFEKIGLPIWVVDAYSQIESLSEQQLLDKYDELKPRFDSKALWFDFWENKINS